MSDRDLFNQSQPAAPLVADAALPAPAEAAALQFYPTPVWAAEALVAKYFPDLGPDDLVLEPCAGTGSFLHAIPRGIPGVGVEIDPGLAAIARRDTGRQVICGDFRTVELKLHPTAVISNPPFAMGVFDGILARCHELLPRNAAAGFILPASAFQVPSRVLNYADKWSLSSELLPRTLFPNLSCPLVFAMFHKSRRGVLVGFSLYRETRSVEGIRPEFRELLAAAKGSAWREAVAKALAVLGGEASLDAIYRAMEKARPTGNTWWRQQVRKVLRRDLEVFRSTGEARYALAA